MTSISVPQMMPFCFAQTISIFVLVELAWNNTGKRTSSSNHKKTQLLVK